MPEPLTVREVLDAEPQATITEAEYALLLRRYLRETRPGVLTPRADIDVMAGTGGSARTRSYAEAYTDEQGRDALARAAARTRTHDLSATLSRAEVAARLGVSPSTVSRRASTGALLTWRVGPDQVRCPAWQFAADRLLPHLAEVFAAVPEHTHPRLLAGRMTAPQEELDGQSPAQWLAAGGEPAPALAIVRELGRE